MATSQERVEYVNSCLARNVMGWTWDDRLLGWVTGPTIGDLVSKREWQPLRDANQAFRVADAARAKGTRLCLTEVESGVWAADFSRGDFPGSAMSANRNVAICLAAMDYLGVNIEAMTIWFDSKEMNEFLASQ